jgi:hypothetical protein
MEPGRFPAMQPAPRSSGDDVLLPEPFAFPQP